MLCTQLKASISSLAVKPGTEQTSISETAMYFVCYIVSSCSAALLSSSCVRDNTEWQEEIVAFRGTGVKDWIYNMYSQIGVHWKGL